MKGGGISPGSLGAAYELAVAADLIRRGFSVFRNLSPNGSTDLLACKNNRVLRVQVKERGLDTTGANDVSAEYNGGNIRYATCNDDDAALIGAPVYESTRQRMLKRRRQPAPQPARRPRIRINVLRNWKRPRVTMAEIAERALAVVDCEAQHEHAPKQRRAA